MGLLFDFAETKELDLDSGSKRSIARNVANSPQRYSGAFESKARFCLLIQLLHAFPF